MAEHTPALQARLRRLPGVDAVLRTDPARSALEGFGQSLTVEAVREVLEKHRQQVLKGGGAPPDAAAVAKEALSWLAQLLAPSLRPVVNATGIIVHTNLGRAPLSQAALDAVAAVAGGYSTLEYDLEVGARGSRAIHAETLLTRLTGAEAALVVNNNAAAVLLMLAALCQGRRVVISRGQLVEIGGGFRVPDVMAQSGAQMVEVGTTNRTHLRDYETAIDESTVAILVAHHSNYKIVGFTSEPPMAELAELAQRKGVYLLYDQGSGGLLDTSVYGLEAEPTVLAGLASGADVVAFSGDKLLGGPQAGILCGRAAALKQIKRHPLARAMRADKLALAALTATLHPYLTGRVEDVPVWRMIARALVDLQAEAGRWVALFRQAGIDCQVEDGLSAVGGGSLPGATLSTRVVAISCSSVDALAAALRRQKTPIIARVVNDRLTLDPRTVLPGQEDTLVQGVIQAVGLLDREGAR